MTYCTTCYGNNVELQEWVNPNTDAVSGGESPYSDYESAYGRGMSFCHDCTSVQLLADGCPRGSVLQAARDLLIEEYGHNPDDDSSYPALIHDIDKVLGEDPTDLSAWHEDDNEVL